MTTLGKYCHDFPKLAKESGYCFELHRGRVNWADIESLNIDDLVNNRNFQLLEQNLVNVINCNLEREYDVKILDPNFVKLFQLAQLGVDYLSYCELYLDRCVILLQEQLASYQEECELLREENQKKNEQLRESKRKIKTESFFQCKKCEKLFLTEVYLKSHEKRRHSNIAETPKTPEISKIETVSKSQQTETEKRTHTVSTQTLVETEPIKEHEEINSIKKEHKLKMGNLEKELEALKERLQTTEKKLTEKNEPAENNHPQQYPFPPNPLFYPQVIPFISPYVSQPRVNYMDVNPDYQQPFVQQYSKKPEPEKKPMVEKQSQVDEGFSPRSPKSPKSPKIIKNESPKNIRIEKPVRPKIVKSRRRLNYNKENLDPALESPVEEIKPIPFPRKPKKLFEDKERGDSLTNVTSFIDEPEPEPEPERKIESPVVVTPTRNLEDDDLISSPVAKVKHIKSKSFFKKMISRNSPKIQELSKNLKRSLTNLYDSVSSGGRDSIKSKDEDSDGETKSDVVEGLNSRLRELGIDPEWSGIPKQTMKQKLKTLEHRRNLLARENPMYPSIRKRLEKSIFKKMNKSSVLSQGKQSASIESLYVDSPKLSISPIPKEPITRLDDKERERETEPESVKQVTMYDFDFDSESDNSNPEVPVKINKPNRFSSDREFPEKIEEKENEIEVIKIDNSIGKSSSKPVKETDFSIFQIGKSKESPKKIENLPKSTVLNTVDELQTDSDFDDEFLKEFEESSFKSINGILSSTMNDKKMDEHSNEKQENQSILKNPQTGLPRPQSSVKKKVLFADYPATESQSSSTTLNDIKPFGEKSKLNVQITKKHDTWSSDSDWDQ